MNGYGGQGMAQQVTPEQYAQALQTYNVLKQRQDHQQAMAHSGNPFALLGAALGGMMGRKFGKYKDTNMSDVSQQIQAFQDQKAQELAQIEAQKAEQDYQRKLRDDQAKWEREHKGKIELKNMDINSRQPKQPSWEQQIFARMTPEQQNSYINKMAGVQSQGNQLFTPQEQALIQAGKVDPEQLAQVKANDAMGVKPEKKPTGEALNKLGLLETAERDLNQYINEAFINGDYQEIGSKFGGTNAKLKSAVMNALRAESGAAIGEQEVDNFMDTYGPSMFSSDETNMKKIQGLVEKIRTQKQALSGGIEQKPAQSQGQLTSQGMEKTQQLLNKYLSK